MGLVLFDKKFWEDKWASFTGEPTSKTNVRDNVYLDKIQGSSSFQPDNTRTVINPAIALAKKPGKYYIFQPEYMEDPLKADEDTGPSVDTPLNIENISVYENSVIEDIAHKKDQLPLIAEEPADPGCGPVIKIRLPATLGKTEYKSEREIRPPYTKGRIKGEKKFIFDLVDSSGASHAIRLSDCSIISGFSLTPAPESLTINSAKVVNRYHTMSRWVEEHWGDTLDTITFSGGSYGLFQLKSGNGSINGGVGEGLTEVHRRESEAYKMLKEVANIYRSNGMLYQDNKTYESSDITTAFLQDQANSYFESNHPRRGLPKERLYVKLFYDYMTCLGYIESFDIMEDANTPFRIKYSISFKSEKTIFHQGNSATAQIGSSIGTG